MNSFKVFLVLAIGFFYWPVMALPSFQGTVENLTDFPSEKLRVRVTWSCRHWGDGPTPSQCRPRSTEAPLVGGRFTTKPIATPPVPLGYGEGIHVEILAPAIEPVSAMTSGLSDLKSRFLQLGFFQTNGAQLQLRLRDGRDFREWVQSEAPARSIEINYSLTVNGAHSLREMTLYDFTSDRLWRRRS